MAQAEEESRFVYAFQPRKEEMAFPQKVDCLQSRCHSLDFATIMSRKESRGRACISLRYSFQNLQDYKQLCHSTHTTHYFSLQEREETFFRTSTFLFKHSDIVKYTVAVIECRWPPICAGAERASSQYLIFFRFPARPANITTLVRDLCIDWDSSGGGAFKRQNKTQQMPSCVENVPKWS